MLTRLKSKKITQYVLDVFADDHQTCYHGLVQAYPVHEKYVIEKSIEFFNDPHPCFIHKSAVIARLLSEFEEYVVSKINDGRFFCDFRSLPAQQQRLFVSPERIQSIACYPKEVDQ